MHRLAILASLFATAAAAQVQPITPAQFPACEASVPAGQKALCVVEVIKAPAPPPVEPPPAPPPPPPPPPAPPPPAPPPPPPPAPPPSPGGYDVDAAYASLPGARPVKPTAPRWTVTYSAVRNSSELAVALAQAARRIACVPGSTFNQPVTVSQPDTLLDMTGCTVNDGVGATVLRVNADRAMVVNGDWRGGFAIGRRADVRLHGVTFTGENPSGSLNEVMYATRVLIDGATLTQRSNNVGLWAQQAPDLVVANSRVENFGRGQATVRIHGSKHVVMDSYVSNPTHHTLRAHADGAVVSPYVAWMRNVIQGGWVQAWGGTGDPVQVREQFIVGNAFHANATGFFINHPSSTVATITGNQVFNGGGGFSWPTGPGWTVSGNTSAPYRAAPAWSIR